MAASTIGDLPAHCLQYVFSCLPGKSCGAVACVSRGWRQTVCDELLWSELCRRDWGIDQPLWPDGIVHNSFREAYAVWQRDFGPYGPLAPRACRAVSTIFAWMQRNLPAIAASLRPGASEAELDAAAEAVGLPLPPALRVLYRFVNGQELAMDRALDAENSAPLHESMLHGLFGSYCIYDHVVSTRLLPLARLVRWTKLAREQMFGGGPLLLFAASFNFNKMLLADAHTGIVKACLANKSSQMDAVPPLGPASPADGVLRWLEEYAARLASGRYRATTITDAGVPPTPALSLFDLARPSAAEAVTRGVRVSASPLFVPEHSKLDGGQPRHFFAYCIRLGLLSISEQRAGGEKRPLKSVQLRSRHWRIRNARGELADEIHGDGVIGQFPLLKAGGPEFSYCSCMNQSQPQGFMEGAFSFVPGNLSYPSGAEFEARCPRFALVVPSFIF